jgi:hypothetical protein
MTKFKEFINSNKEETTSADITEGFFDDIFATVKITNKIKDIQEETMKEFANIIEFNGTKDEIVKRLRKWSETSLTKVGTIIKHSNLSLLMKETYFAGFISGVFKTMSVKFSDLTGSQITEMLGWNNDISNIAFAEGAVRNIAQSKAIKVYIGLQG